MQINYIKHLNAVFIQFSRDNRLNPTHISLYVALFQLWNIYHFPDEFYINREEVMRFSKIGSKTTYHRCIKDLSHWKYLLYKPSHNPFQGSRIKMFNFETSEEQVEDLICAKTDTSCVQAVASNTNENKQLENNTNKNKLGLPQNVNEVIDFFEKENWSELEANKFFNHYQGIGWKMGGKIKIVDWRAIAHNWILKAEEFQNVKTEVTLSQNKDNLKTSSHKNYSEPL